MIPLGLAAWIAFSFGFVLVNGSYALAVLSDPFGWRQMTTAYTITNPNPLSTISIFPMSTASVNKSATPITLHSGGMNAP